MPKKPKKPKKPKAELMDGFVCFVEEEWELEVQGAGRVVGKHRQTGLVRKAWLKDLDPELPLAAAWALGTLPSE